MPARIDKALRLFVAQSRDYALIVISPAGIIEGWLGAAEDVFGYASDEVVGRHSEILFRPDDVAAEMPKHELDVASSAGRSEDDRWMRRKDGQDFWALGAVTPLFDDDGKLVGYAKVLSNRTDVKVQLEALERRNDELECQDEQKSTFIRKLSHELRNPLGAMSNAVSVLRRSAIGSDDLQQISEILGRQLSHLSGLIEDLLDVSRIETGKLSLRQETTSLQDSCEGCLRRVLLRSPADTRSSTSSRPGPRYS